MNRLLIVATSSLAIALVAVMDFSESAPIASAASAIPARSYFRVNARHTASAAIRRVNYSPEERENTNNLPVMDREEAAARWKKMETWMRCLDGNPCGLPEKDARETGFIVRDGLMKEGRWFLEHSTAAAEVPRSYRAAKQLLAFPDEQVQGLALQWLIQLPVDPETTAILRENLSDMVDPELAHLTMVELARHIGTGQETAALDLVQELLFDGGIFASREVARSISLVTAPSNRGRVERWISELPPTSAKVRLLKESLDQ